MKIKIRKTGKGYIPQIIKKGDWIDLHVPKDTLIRGPYAKQYNKETKSADVVFSNELIDLEIAMKLPAGYEAHVLPRSSTYNKYGVILANQQGIIDNSYSSNKDTWKFNALAFQDICIPAGVRIAQFRIVLSQKATMWQKIKWLFSSKIEIVEVDDLGNNVRGGIGSTGD